MKKNFLWTLSFVFLGMTAISTFTSCLDNADACADVVCVNADCFEGECICQVGFVKDANGDCVAACDDANCPPNSACVGNECVCDIGFENDANGDCVLERMKFTGNWFVADTCDGSGAANYAVTVNSGVDDDKVEVIRFYEIDDFNVVATIVGTSITIDRQNPLGDLLYVEGTGTIDETGEISWSYTISDEDPVDPATDNCTSTWKK